MPRITATTPAETVPSWALWQRQLLRAMDDVVEPYLAHFTRENGEFIWDDAWGGGSPDDFFEPFFNWPLVYLMGGGDHLLYLCQVIVLGGGIVLPIDHIPAILDRSNLAIVPATVLYQFYELEG